MRGSDADAAFLWHMLEAARRIQTELEGVDKDDYMEDVRRHALVERWLEIIGEAARRVSREFRQAHPEIPWSQMIAQRNIIAHWYYNVRQDLVWDSATIGVPALIQALEPLVPPLPP